MLPLRVTSDGRYVETTAGEPYFFLGDTAWALAHRLNCAEAEYYLSIRAEQRFNAIQFTILAEQGGLTIPNQQGDLPLLEMDPLKINERYFTHVDGLVERMNALHIFPVILPTWGDKVNLSWGEGPELFNEHNAEPYGRLLAERWKNRHVIWMLGGDRPVETERHLLVWRGIAQGIRSVVGRSQMITYHPNGFASSSKYVHDEDWLDFNTMQSGHTGLDLANWRQVELDRQLTPTKPTLDAEPNYEAHPIMMMHQGKWIHNTGHFTDHDVRKSLYRSLLAGAAGYTYGCHAIWQFFDPARNPPINKPLQHWRESVLLPGAQQLRHALELLAVLRPHGPLLPMQSALEEMHMSPPTQMVAARFGNTTAAIYSPVTQTVRIALPRLGFRPRTARWFDPATGLWSPAQIKPVTVCVIEVEPTLIQDGVLVLEA